MQKEISSKLTYNYLLHLPEDYAEAEKWPMIVYLHGIGAKGNHLGMLKAHGLPEILDGWDDFPFIVISPQCPSDQEWSISTLSALVSRVTGEYNIDDNKV